MFILYTDPDVSEDCLIFACLEAAEAKRTKIASARTEGMCKERFCLAEDYMIIEEWDGTQDISQCQL